MKRLCRICKKRPALYKRGGKVKARKDHDICQQCFRSLVDKNAVKE